MVESAISSVFKQGENVEAPGKTKLDFLPVIFELLKYLFPELVKTMI